MKKVVINKYTTFDIKIDSTIKEFSILCTPENPFYELIPHSFLVNKEDLEDDEILEFKITIEPIVKKRV